VNSGEDARQEAQKNARPPEYIIIHRQSSPRTGAQHQPQPKKTRQSAREAQLEERLSRREQLREQRYAARLRRQWVLAIVLVVVLLAFIVLARCNT
jgi:hypothetical protein